MWISGYGDGWVLVLILSMVVDWMLRLSYDVRKGFSVSAVQSVPRMIHSPSFLADIAARSSMSIPVSEIPAIREKVVKVFSTRLSMSLAKQADDQALVSLLAFHNYMTQSQESLFDYPGWGLVVAPRFPGRKRTSESILKFQETGAWSVSPHIIPNCSLHSISGILSQVLGIYGPNLGVGGMPGTECDALLTANTWLHGDALPGVWVVLSGYSGEDHSDQNRFCQSLILKLQPSMASSNLPTMALRFGTGVRDFSIPEFSLEWFLDWDQQEQGSQIPSTEANRSIRAEKKTLEKRTDLKLFSTEDSSISTLSPPERSLKEFSLVPTPVSYASFSGNGLISLHRANSMESRIC